MTYREQEQPMNIEKSNDNFKNKKPKYFNYNKYRYIVKECWSKKKECEIRKCFKCDKEGHIAKDCKRTQLMKKRKVQKGSDNEDKEKKQGFDDDLE